MYQGGENPLQGFWDRFDADALHMNEELYTYLESMFIRSNIPKYRKYFKEWIDNVTEEQLVGFERMMNANYKQE
jgi:hypothetical protein